MTKQNWSFLSIHYLSLSNALAHRMLGSESWIEKFVSCENGVNGDSCYKLSCKRKVDSYFNTFLVQFLNVFNACVASHF